MMRRVTNAGLLLLLCWLLTGCAGLDLDDSKTDLLATEISGWADTIETFLEQPGREDQLDKYAPRIDEARLLADALTTGDFSGSTLDALRSLGDPFEEALVLIGLDPDEAALIRQSIRSALTILEFSTANGDSS